MKKLIYAIFILLFLLSNILYSQQTDKRKTMQLFIINKKDSIIAEKEIFLKKIDFKSIVYINFITDTTVIRKIKIENIDTIIELELKRGEEYNNNIK